MKKHPKINKGRVLQNLRAGNIRAPYYTMEHKTEKELSENRWKIAQESEKEFWVRYTTDSLKKELDKLYSKKAEALLKGWSKWIKVDKNIKILQIGCGPEDVINHFKIGKKYSIDPLAEFYKKRFKFDYKESGLVEAMGEKMPFSDKYFNVVVLMNVLDHVHLPGKVLSEINRVMQDNGILYFENFIYQKNFIRIAKIWGKFRKIFTGKIFNIHHPYMFTSSELKRILSKKFLILHENIGGDIGIYKNMEELKKSKRRNKRLRVKIPAIFGLYGIINYTLICKNKTRLN